MALAVVGDAEVVVRAAAARRGVDGELATRRARRLDGAAAGLDAVAPASAPSTRTEPPPVDTSTVPLTWRDFDAAAARAQRIGPERAVDLDAAAAGLDAYAAGEAARADAAAAGLDLELARRPAR